jgi:hypothetical protein
MTVEMTELKYSLGLQTLGLRNSVEISVQYSDASFGDLRGGRLDGRGWKVNSCWFARALYSGGCCDVGRKQAGLRRKLTSRITWLALVI